MGLIEVKSGDVSITEKGYSVLSAATPHQQKIILKQELLNLKPFQKLVELIKQSKTGYITKQELLKYYYSSLSSDSSSDDYSSYPAGPGGDDNGDDEDDNDNNDNYSYDFENNFDRIIAWGRAALLIDYNSNDERIKLRHYFTSDSTG